MCSYHTFAPLLALYGTGLSQRFIFCGTFPKVTLAGDYPALCFHGARTFLSSDRRAAPEALTPEVFVRMFQEEQLPGHPIAVE